MLRCNERLDANVGPASSSRFPAHISASAKPRQSFNPPRTDSPMDLTDIAKVPYIASENRAYLHCHLVAEGKERHSSIHGHSRRGDTRKALFARHLLREWPP